MKLGMFKAIIEEFGNTNDDTEIYLEGDDGHLYSLCIKQEPDFLVIELGLHLRSLCCKYE